MLWQTIVEKLVGYGFMLGILYIAADTIKEVNNDNKILLLKEQLKAEIREENRQLNERIIRVEVKQDEYSISQSNRMNQLDETLTRVIKEGQINR